MAKSVNQVILMGRLTADVDLRTTASGKNVADFTLAVDSGQDQSDKSAFFFDVTAWEKLADLVSQYTHKGSKVLVMGRLVQQTWEKDGQKRSKVTIVATDVTFLDPKQSTDSDTPSNTNSNATSSEQNNDKPIDLSEIPF